MKIELIQPYAQLVALGLKKHILMPFPAMTVEYNLYSSEEVIALQADIFRNKKVKMALAQKGIAKWEQLSHNKHLCNFKVLSYKEVTRANPGALSLLEYENINHPEALFYYVWEIIIT